MKNRSEFVVYLENYNKVVYGTHVLISLHFRMMSKLEESSLYIYSTTTRISPLKWPKSQWCNIRIRAKESITGI